jgi:hypothetical protein
MFAFSATEGIKGLIFRFVIFGLALALLALANASVEPLPQQHWRPFPY